MQVNGIGSDLIMRGIKFYNAGVAGGLSNANRSE